MFKIGAFSKLANVSIRALHHYEEIGLLLPVTIDEQTNYRYYSLQQLSTMNKIKMLQQIGFSLNTIKEVLTTNDQSSLEYHYELRESQIIKELEELKTKQLILKTLKEHINHDGFIEHYNVVLKTIPKRSVMSIRKTVSSYDDEYTLWEALQEVFIKQNIKMDATQMSMTIYHDQEYKESNIDIEVQSAVVGDYLNTRDVTFYTTSEFTIAAVTFNGSYDQMPAVTHALALWIEANHYTICGPMINIPHVSPAQDPNPEHWITEAGFVVSKA